MQFRFTCKYPYELSKTLSPGVAIPIRTKNLCIFLKTSRKSIFFPGRCKSTWITLNSFGGTVLWTIFF